MLFRIAVSLFSPLLARNFLIPSSLVKKAFNRIHAWSLEGRHGARPVVVETCAGRMELAASDVTSCFPLLFRIWEPALARFVMANLKPGDRFVDVGANIGFYTLLAHRLGARPTAFEPSPRVLPLLFRNLELNGMDRGVVECLALSDKSGTAPLFEGPPGNLGRSSLSPDADQTGNASQMVQTAPVHAYAELLRDARMIKIDVEGHEARLLKYLLPEEISLRKDCIILVEIDLRNRNEITKVLQERMRNGLQLFLVENEYTVRFYRKNRYRVARMTEQDFQTLEDLRVDVILSTAPMHFPPSDFLLR